MLGLKDPNVYWDWMEAGSASGQCSPYTQGSFVYPQGLSVFLSSPPPTKRPKVQKHDKTGVSLHNRIESQSRAFLFEDGVRQLGFH